MILVIGNIMILTSIDLSKFDLFDSHTFDFLSSVTKRVYKTIIIPRLIICKTEIIRVTVFTVIDDVVSPRNRHVELGIVSCPSKRK